jgi:hypothetical protein
MNIHELLKNKRYLSLFNETSRYICIKINYNGKVNASRRKGNALTLENQ